MPEPTDTSGQLYSYVRDGLPTPFDPLPLPYAYLRHPRIPLTGDSTDRRTAVIGGIRYCIDPLGPKHKLAKTAARTLPERLKADGSGTFTRQLLGTFLTDDDQMNPLVVYLPMGFIARSSSIPLSTSIVNGEVPPIITALCLNPERSMIYPSSQSAHNAKYQAGLVGTILHHFYGLHVMQFDIYAPHPNLLQLTVAAVAETNELQLGKQ